MTNHVHFMVAPETEIAMARTFGRAHADYARYANIAHRSCGHFWQARFYSCALDPSHAWRALAYIERNPVRAAIAACAEGYEWSSAAAHCDEDDREGRLDLAEWQRSYSGVGWRDVLRFGTEEQAWAERLREATRCGLPMGSEEFVGQISQRVGRDLRKRPPGRPPKEPGLAGGPE